MIPIDLAHRLLAGLLGENAMWSASSRRLFLFCWKDKIEAVRKTKRISGYEWWLLQDFWLSLIHI